MTKSRMAEHPNSFVYVMHDGAGAKIGVASCVETRRLTVQTGNPRRVEIKFTSIPLITLMAYAVERAAHRYLDACRLEGEWFAIGPGFAEETVQRCIADMLFQDRPRARKIYWRQSD